MPAARIQDTFRSAVGIGAHWIGEEHHEQEGGEKSRKRGNQPHEQGD